MKYDFIVIGAGIIGMATAWKLQQSYPGKSVLVLEKESGPARHQTGRNSGVIHAGVYYAPGSLKSKFCREGNAATKAFCREHGIRYDQCGKMLVATSELELERMQGLIARCAENDIDISVLSQPQLKEREPNISGVGAVFVPSTGIVSFSEITAKMADLVGEGGGAVLYNSKVTAIDERSDGVRVHCGGDSYEGSYLVVCAGLMSDRLIEMMGLAPGFKVIPFRGEYFLLAPQHNRIVNHLVYPIPDPELPFLGVHLTRMIDGTVTVGPNAVLALKREGYRKTDISPADCFEMLTYPGLLKVLRKNFKVSLIELKNSLYKRGYLEQVRKYCPSLALDDMKDYPAGVRAQAVTREGVLVQDFLFVNSRRALAVGNAPSPAATSAIPIADHIVQKLKELMEA